MDLTEHNKNSERVWKKVCDLLYSEESKKQRAHWVMEVVFAEMLHDLNEDELLEMVRESLNEVLTDYRKEKVANERGRFS